MVRLVRRSHRLRASVAILLATIIVGGTIDWWHADDEDAPVPVFHDHLAHHPRIGEVRSLTAPNEHCFICHWLRSLHNGLRDVGFSAVTLGPSACLPVASSKHVLIVAVTSLSARAPPALV